MKCKHSECRRGERDGERKENEEEGREEIGGLESTREKRRGEND